MKILLLFVTVVCVVQANIVIQVVQEVGEDGYGLNKGGRGDGGGQGEEGEGGGGGGGEGGGGEGLGGGGGGGGDGGGSGSSELVNQLNDLQTRLNDLEAQLLIAEEISFEINDLLSRIPDILGALNSAVELELEEPCSLPEPLCSLSRHRRSVVAFDNCDPSVDLNGDLGLVIKRIIDALFNEMPDAVTSQEPTTFKCYLNRLNSIESDLQGGQPLVKEEYMSDITASFNAFKTIAEGQQGPADAVIEKIKADIADIETQIAEKEAAIEEAESSDDE